MDYAECRIIRTKEQFREAMLKQLQKNKQIDKEQKMKEQEEQKRKEQEQKRRERGEDRWQEPR